MCTIVLLRRPGHPWPLLYAGNRDEWSGRPWDPPARHWPKRPSIAGGLDRVARGSWLGVNDSGVLACVLNRVGPSASGPAARSRGELVLLALEHFRAQSAVAELARLEQRLYLPFNLIVADEHEAFWIHSTPHGHCDGPVAMQAVPPGLSMFAATHRNDLSSPRIGRYLPRFREADVPNPERAGGWDAWQSLLDSRDHEPADGPCSAMCRVAEHGFGTLSSSLIGIPASHRRNRRCQWWFAARGGCDEAYHRVVF
jgi:hypothetical protein